jgi:hypothetical protein
VLGEPGTVGAALHEIEQASGEHPEHVSAALHHRRPRLRLHDILLWLTTTLHLPHAVELGRASDEWQGHRAGGYDEPGPLPCGQRAERGRGGRVEAPDR